MTDPEPTRLTDAEADAVTRLHIDGGGAKQARELAERIKADAVAAARADERRKVAEEIAADIEYRCPKTGANAARVARTHATEEGTS